MWQPDPVRTDDVVLPASVAGEREVLSRHAHDTWGRKRIGDGWRYGPARDDEARTHPNLVPYDELADKDKEYDRELITETLRFLVKLGYVIERAAPAHEEPGAPGGARP